MPCTTVSCSDNGWMTTEIFTAWFDTFCTSVTTRPIILVYDGHITHVSIDIVEKARAQNIVIIKLPPHTTDRLQPLDVSCFKSLQAKWDRSLHTFTVQNAAAKLTKTKFLEQLGSVWPEVFTETNIKNGFRKCGLFPVNRREYPESAFLPSLLVTYKAQNPALYTDTPVQKPHTPLKFIPTVTIAPGTVTFTLPTATQPFTTITEQPLPTITEQPLPTITEQATTQQSPQPGTSTGGPTTSCKARRRLDLSPPQFNDDSFDELFEMPEIPPSPPPLKLPSAPKSSTPKTCDQLIASTGAEVTK